jgi:Protein of unknown function (DUF2924)
MLNIEREVAQMKQMTVDQLRKKYAQVFAEPTNARHKDWLIKRIAWRMQAKVEGDLSERARRRALELANDADIRMNPPRERKQPESVPTPTPVGSEDHLLPGTKFQRVYKGKIVDVEVTESGFKHNGERYKSLTAVAKAVTGKHWNGFHFFNVRKKGGE